MRFILASILFVAVMFVSPLASTIAFDVTPTSLPVDDAGRFGGVLGDFFWAAIEVAALAIAGISTGLYKNSLRPTSPRTLVRNVTAAMPGQVQKLQRRSYGSYAPAPWLKGQHCGRTAECTECEDEATRADRISKWYTRYTRMISDCVKYPNGPVRAVSLLKQMNNEGYPPNLLNFGAAIGVCSKKEGAYEVALTLMEAIRKRGLEPDVVCYNAAITACSKSYKLKESLELVREMRQQGLPPTVVTCNAAIDACGKVGEYSMARQLLREMRAMGLDPSEKSYGPAIHACAKHGCWGAALELLDEMEQYGVAPNLHCFSSAINACGKAGRVRESFKLLESMRTAGIQPNQICYCAAITACARGKDVNAGVKLFGQMKHEGLTPDVITYNVLLNALKAAGKSGHAAALLQEMHEVGHVQTTPSSKLRC